MSRWWVYSYEQGMPIVRLGGDEYFRRTIVLHAPLTSKSVVIAFGSPRSGYNTFLASLRRQGEYEMGRDRVFERWLGFHERGFRIERRWWAK